MLKILLRIIFNWDELLPDYFLVFFIHNSTNCPCGMAGLFFGHRFYNSTPYSMSLGYQSIVVIEATGMNKVKACKIYQTTAFPRHQYHFQITPFHCPPLAPRGVYFGHPPSPMPLWHLENGGGVGAGAIRPDRRATLQSAACSSEIFDPPPPPVSPMH